MHTVYHTKKGVKLDVSREAKDILREVQACCDTSTGSSSPVREEDDEEDSELGVSSRMRMRTGDAMVSYARSALMVASNNNSVSSDELSSKIDLARQLVQAQIAAEYSNPATRVGPDYIFGMYQEAFEQLALMLLREKFSRRDVEKHLKEFSAAQKQRLKDPAQTSLAFKVFRVISQNPTLPNTALALLAAPVAAAPADRDAQEKAIRDVFDGINLKTQEIRDKTSLRLQQFASPDPATAANQAQNAQAAPAAAAPANLSQQELVDAMKSIEITDVHIFNWMMRHDVHVPIVIVVARPFVRLQVASAALLQSGGVLGKTYYANPMTGSLRCFAFALRVAQVFSQCRHRV